MKGVCVEVWRCDNFFLVKGGGGGIGGVGVGIGDWDWFLVFVLWL